MDGVGVNAVRSEPNIEVEKPADQTLSEYLTEIADQLVNELKPVVALPGMKGNSALLGAYAEAVVRNLVRRVVSPMRVSTGAVIDYPKQTKLRQIDIIIWMPHPAPAIYEVENFGMVPRSSSFGVLEVKRSNYSQIENHFDELIHDARDRKIVSDLGLPGESERVPALNVVTVLERKPSKRLVKMFENRSAAMIIDGREDPPAVSAAGVFVLINFLSFVVWRYSAQRAQPSWIEIPLHVFNK